MWWNPMEEHVAAAVEAAVKERQTPGAVVLIGRSESILCHEAYGYLSSSSASASKQQRPPARKDTVYDVASLTKPLATATAILQLAERGKLLLSDTIASHIPAWLPTIPTTTTTTTTLPPSKRVDSTGSDQQQQQQQQQQQRGRATLRHLLTHSTGLPAYKNYAADPNFAKIPLAERRARVVQDICSLPLEYPVGQGFSYSCLGYILLATIVEQVTGQPLDEYCQAYIYKPLGMKDTCFNPSGELLERCAPTEQLPEGTLRGVVHDEVARYLGGVGGNAGLFSTAHDISIFMTHLNRAFRKRNDTPPPMVTVFGGEREVQFPLLSPAAAAAMARPTKPLPGTDGVLRGLGWDVHSSLSGSVRGDLFVPGKTFGHTGYTGCSIWADASSGVYCILVTNRVHLGRDRDISRLRSQVANIAASSALHAWSWGWG